MRIGIRPWFAVAIATIVTIACGSNSSTGNNASSTRDGGGDDSSVFATDSGFSSGSSSGSSGSSSGSGSGGGGACTTACTGGQNCVNGTCTCPAYQSFCNGACIPTSVDPNNCGGCGTACTGAMACSGGACSSSCLPGLTLCTNDHTCSDTQNDSNHCGSCGNKCGAGQGCVAGACVNSVPLGAAPGKCVGGGPPIVNPAGLGGCLGALAATTFRWTLCSCKDVSCSDLLFVDAYDSTKGPYKPGGIGGGVGADGRFASSADSTIWGDLWTSSPSGINDSASDVVKHELRTGGPLSSSGMMTIGADAYANGNVSGNISIGGKLYAPMGATVSVNPAGGIVRGPVSFAPPCDCMMNQLVPVTAMVQNASTNNDNAAIMLDPNVLASPNGPTRLDLPCGSYYLSSIKPSVPVTIWAHGQTALYIGGDVNSSDALAFGVDPNGAFDIFIAGSLNTSSGLTIGSPNYPALTRTYVGSTAGVDFSSEVTLDGEFYAAYGTVNWSADTDAYGSIFAGNFNASSAARIHYDLGVLRAGDSCPPPPGHGGGPSDAGPSEAGAPPGGGCVSCRDCNNQACISGQCGSCLTSNDCCSPLVCTGGTCAPAIIK